MKFRKVFKNSAFNPLKIFYNDPSETTILYASISTSSSSSLNAGRVFGSGMGSNLIWQFSDHLESHMNFFKPLQVANKLPHFFLFKASPFEGRTVQPFSRNNSSAHC
jgi:hypothetical protein